MARAHYVKAARKARPEYGIKVGDPYWWWQFRNCGKSYSATPPRRSQLTRSNFLSQMYDLEDGLSWEATSPEDLESTRDDIVQQLESLKDECQESLDNMPEHLQESSDSGQTLQQRIEGLENAISEYEGVDLSYDGEAEDTEAMTAWLEEKRDELGMVTVEY